MFRILGITTAFMALAASPAVAQNFPWSYLGKTGTMAVFAGVTTISGATTARRMVTLDIPFTPQGRVNAQLTIWVFDCAAGTYQQTGYNLLLTDGSDGGYHAGDAGVQRIDEGSLGDIVSGVACDNGRTEPVFGTLAEAVAYARQP